VVCVLREGGGGAVVESLFLAGFPPSRKRLGVAK